jgi:hypothetical protein
MRTFRGIRSLSPDSVRLESAVANVTPRVMIIVLRMLFVTARVEHMPRIWMNIGLLVQRLSLSIVRVFEFFTGSLPSP